MNPHRGLRPPLSPARIAAPACLLVAGGLLGVLPGTAVAQGGFRVTELRAEYELRRDGSFDVVERIDVDFGYLHRHGIHRDIELSRRQRLDVRGVTDGDGRPLPVDIERRRRTRIRIGDPERTVTGVQSYVLRYTVRGGLDHRGERAELYWQVTGTDSEVPIESAEATVTLPVQVTASGDATGSLAARCFAGPPESSDASRCSAEASSPGRFRFAATDLAPGEGLTMRADFPAEMITRPAWNERWLLLLTTFGPLGFPLLALAGLLLAWARSGRDPRAGSVTPEWRLPENLAPGLAGVLLDDRVDTRDLVAVLIDLARRGYVRIGRSEAPGPLARAGRWRPAARALEDLGLGGWRLDLLTTDRTGLEVYERLFLDGLFGDARSRRLIDLRTRFPVHLPEIHRALYRQLVIRRLVRNDPAALRRRWAWSGFAILVAGAGSVALGRDLLGIGIAGSGILVMLFSKIMPAVTPRGAALRRHLRGLEEYVRRAEKSEIEFREAPERTPERFSEMLPYAVALGVTDEWTRQFAGRLTRQPEWLAAGVDGLDALEGLDLTGMLSEVERSVTRAFDWRPEIPLDVVVDGLGSVGGGGGGGGIGGW